MDALPPDIAAFDDAQRRAWAVLSEVLPGVVAGATPADVIARAREAALREGFTAWFHAPEIAVGEGIGGGIRARLGALRPRPLAEGDLVSVDLGPATSEACADVGVTVRVGGGSSPVLDVARSCVEACCGFASRWKTVGEIHVFARAWCVNRRMDLAQEGAVGHRVLPRAGLLSAGWPRSAHLATLVARNRIHRLHPVRMQGMFAIRPVVRGPDGTCAAFEEIVWIDGDQRRVLGRDRLEDVGSVAC